MFPAFMKLVQGYWFRVVGVIIIAALFLLITHNSSLITTYAQTNDTPAENAANFQGAATLGMARIVEVKDKDVKDGSILSTSEQGGPVLSNLAYDPQVLGVVSRDAAIVLNTTNSKTGVPIISTGTVYILVSSKEGAIKKGDLLTTSTIPGVAVKAKKSGYVLGTSLEDYDNPDSTKSNLIAADLDLHYFNSKPTFPGSLSDIFKIALLPTKEAPTPIFKYIVAAAVVIASFVLAFLSFGRTAAKGVEALGRNPAAGKLIHLGIIFNVGIVVVIVFVGLIVAFLILRL
jgi:F0F1-type ATP synthase membrane subunit c/vacuolar-type H+-ATPase subunit K